MWSALQPPDGSLAAAAVVVEELGRALYAGPAVEALIAGYVLHRPGDSSPVSAFVVVEDAPFVQPAPEAPLVIATGRGNLVATSASKVDFTDIPSLDVTRRIVQLKPGALQTDSASASDGDLARQARAARTLLYSADTLGCVERVLQRAAEYANQRTTFGSPIGKYQAVAHRLVDHAVTTQQMRLLLDDAVSAFDDGAQDVALRAATVETFFYERSSQIVSDCIQLAGAIGFTWEFGHHLFLRRVVQNTSLAGGFDRPALRLAKEARW